MYNKSLKQKPPASFITINQNSRLIPCTGEPDVCMMWKNHFSSLYNSVHADHVKLEVLSKLHNGNKCITDNTKAAARQSLNCILKTKK